jgi:hypothetical protein
MAQRGRRGPGTVEAEERTRLERMATNAATAFRDYIITGDAARRTEFWNIYNTSFGGATVHDNSVFMDRLFSELDRLVGQDSRTRPVLEAFIADRGRLFYFLWSNPAHYTDFIDTVHNIRSRLERGIATDDAIARLTERVRSAPTSGTVPAEVRRVRESVAGGMSMDDAVRAELERESREDASSRYGERLTQEVIQRMPAELARRAAGALREFILTGDTTRRDEFRRIWDANTSQAFMTEFTREFRTRIKEDATIGPVVRAWQARHPDPQNPQGPGLIDPGEFATTVTNLYRAASEGNAQEVERIRSTYGNDVADPLLSIVATGMAERSIVLIRRVLESGDSQARDQFASILNGRLVAIVNDRVVPVSSVDQNDVFWNRFHDLYLQEIAQNGRLQSMVRSFGRNILSIAIRDIVSELGRANPDIQRLLSDYRPELVLLIGENIGSMGWLVRPDADITGEIARRARAEDATAIRLRDMSTPTRFNRAHAAGETYIALISERAVRQQLQSAGILEIVEQNFDQLGYLGGTVDEVNAELERRARGRQPDQVAVRLRTAIPRESTARLISMYQRFASARSARARLTQSYGTEFVGFIEQNLGSLYWLLRPVEQIESEMRSRGTEQALRTMFTTTGYSVGTFAQALRDIHTELGRSSSDRSRLTQRYGAELVQFVETNRANLQWLSGDIASIERALQERTDAHTTELKSRWLYGYRPVLLVSAIARSRAAISRGGLARDDARDALGTLFVSTGVSRQAVTTPSVSPQSAEARHTEIESRWRQIEGHMVDIEGQMRYNILEPVRQLLRERIRRWRDENNRIRDEARATQDPAELARLVQAQDTLLNRSMITGGEMRMAVEMAFSMIHLAETGADISRGPVVAGVIPSDIDIGQLRRLRERFRALDPSKQAVMGEIVSAVMRRADPQLFDFIVAMDEPAYFRAVTRVYGFMQRGGPDTRDTLVQVYGEQFVRMMEEQAPNLRVLDSPSATVRHLRQGENELFASIVIRVYRAISTPAGSENRENMVRIFGEDFVRAVEANRAQMGRLDAAGAGLSDVQALPSGVRQALQAAYPGAYSRSIGSLLRAYRRQDDRLFYDLGAVYAVLRTRPPASAPEGRRRQFKQRLGELNNTYGEAFVRTVTQHMAQLGPLLESPSSTVADMRRLPADLLESLHSSFEQGAGPGRARFMDNFQYLSDRLPLVYGRLRSSLVFANATDQLGTNFAEVVALYRQEFGSNDYLFRQYLNIELLSRSLQGLARRYDITLPPYVADGIDSPEELSRFLQSEAGRALITAGRQAYERIETTYLLERDRANFHPTTGDYSDQNVQNLRNEISILDALYLGIAMERIGGTDSAMGTNGAKAIMNSMLVLAHRDPYLIGPFLLQVVPAIVSVAHDERTLVAAIEAFNNILVQRYEAGTREIAYSTQLNRKYFLGVFEQIGQRLPEVVSQFDHTQLEDELRITPEPRTDEGFLSPLLYRYRPGFWQGEGLEPLPTLYGQQGLPIRLLPRPQMPTSGFLPIPGGFRLDSGAADLYSSMYDQLRPPVDRMFRQRVPPRFRIGALGASTIIRRLNELFGPMPVDYNDYWLSAYGEAGAFYAHEERGASTVERGGAGALATGRTISGGVRGSGRWQRDVTETGGVAGAGQPETTITERRDVVDVTGQAVRLPAPVSGPVPLPLFGLLPWNVMQMPEGTGIHRARQEFHWERAEREQAVAQPGGGTTTVTTGVPPGRTAGLLETYQRIARENSTDMLLFVAGEHVPELRGAPGAGGEPGAITQQPQDRMRSRLYFVTAEGNIYQLAYGVDTEAQLLNYLYGGMNRQEALASVRTIGRDMAPTIPLGDYERRRRIATALGITQEEVERLSDTEIDQRLADRGTSRNALFGTPAGGFDGAAVGFTVPRGGGDTYSALAFGSLVRSMAQMQPVHVEHAVGMAVTDMLNSRSHRDVYAAFYRGAELVTQDPQDRSRIQDARFSQGVGEVMWRRIRIDPRAYQLEVRGVGGYPLTVGGRVRGEWFGTTTREHAVGVTAAWSQVDLLREFRAVDAQADRVYSNVSQMLVSFYNWSEDQARDTGHLISGSYLYARLEDFTQRNPDGTYTTTPGGPQDHFASAMFMYWAQRHGLLMGAQRVPGWSRIYDRIEQAMLEIQRNPQAESTILQTLSNNLRQDFNRDIWRFALAYGYDGERVRVYTLASGQWTGDEQAYGNLYSLFLFGRPTRGYGDILGHAYGYAPLVISEDPGNAAGFRVHRGRLNPYADLYAGFGWVDWPSIPLHRYQRELTVARAVDPTAALRDAYVEMGGTRYRARLERIYGRSFVDVVEEGREGLSWMVRPAGEIRTEMQRRLDEEDPVVLSILNKIPGRESARAAVRVEDADALRDIYIELRKPEPNRERLESSYGRDAVEYVERHAVDFDWVLLPDERMRSEFRTRSQRRGTMEARLASDVRLPAPPAQDQLTGPEVKRYFEQNMREMLAAATDAESMVGLSPDRYDVILGTHLASPEGRRERHGTYYILHTPVAERGEARGSLVIGDETDLDEWMRHGHEIGRGITRLEVSREGGGYKFTFSGDRRLRALTAGRLVGGVSIPLTGTGYETYQVGGNWTVGGLLHLFQDHRLDILGGALYGTRTFGNERWNQWTVTLSGRLQGTMTETVSEQWFGYVFFNRTTKQLVFASNDVFNNADELRQVCTTMAGAQCSDLTELSRMTGGAGITWARADLITGDRFNMHLFFEGGVESYSPLSMQVQQPAAGEAPRGPGAPRDEFVFRTGLQLEWITGSRTSILPNTYFIGATGARGIWPIIPGEITRPEMLPGFDRTMQQGIPGWWFMLHAGFRWGP